MGALQETLEGHSGPVYSVAFSPDRTDFIFDPKIIRASLLLEVLDDAAVRCLAT
jgi:hypothetical protein